eukprot:m.208889 g.208889  ORF g.208889 m.208889 type:complete len:1180 (-) comp17804_c0_seq1:3407-6946(-)
MPSTADAGGDDAPRRHMRPLSPPEESAAHNEVCTTKYRWWNFLPKNLFEQFHRAANVYFLFVVALNWLPDINAFAKEVAMLPLLFVLSVTAVKDLFEDRRRARSDAEVNNSVCEAVCVRDGANPADCPPKDTAWRDLQVGDLVHLRENSVIPADLVLLWTSDANGVCYVETANLDGETNLKHRRAIRQTETAFRATDHVASDFVYELPNNEIYNFNGYMREGSSMTPLDSSNVLLRGCVIRHTDEAWGVIVYAGHDTKAMQNNSGPRVKRSKLERQMNNQVMLCVALLCILCISGGIGSGAWTSRRPYETTLYLPYFAEAGPEPAMEGFLRIWSYFIILQSLVPISLYVSIEIVKLLQIYFIQEDEQMAHPESNTKINCRALNITEDLGQIEYLFSDKTGTLTENVMVFRKCVIGGVLYRHEGHVRPPNATPQSCYDFALDGKLIAALHTTSRDPSSSEYLMMLSLAVCNTVIPKLVNAANDATTAADSGTELQVPAIGAIKHESESPDETALVAAAHAYGFAIVHRSHERLVVNVLGQVTEYKVEAVLPFDSARRKFSIVLRGPDGTLLMLTKGADSAIAECLAPGKTPQAVLESTAEETDKFALDGLRTLSFAYRILDEGEFKSWNATVHAAQMSLGNRAEMLTACYHALERGFVLLGSTGIEDRLQDGVPATIAALREAGIRVWVLTGDKQETAIEIARTCRLVPLELPIILLNSELAKHSQSNSGAIDEQAALEETKALLLRAKESLAQLQSNGAEEGVAIVIDGATLVYALSESLQPLLVEVACAAQAVVCCRVAPIQKALVVKMVKHSLKVTTLAVGDGANDVSMIQMADVGVGISGREGRQAIMASDFSLPKFRFLARLLLVHGHWSYDRLARMILYFFYKNTVFVFLIYFFQFFCGFSARNALDDLFMNTYNLMWTSLPVMITAIFDQDVSDKTLLKCPSLYRHTREGLSYKGKFYPTMADAIWQSIALFFVPFFALRTEGSTDLQSFGTVQFASLVVTVSLCIVMCSRHMHLVHAIGLGISVFGFFGFLLLYNSVCCNFMAVYPSSYYVFQHIVQRPQFWLVLLVSIAMALLPGFLYRVISHRLHPTAVEMARQHELLGERCMNTATAASKAAEDSSAMTMIPSTTITTANATTVTSPVITTTTTAVNSTSHLGDVFTFPDSQGPRWTVV